MAVGDPLDWRGPAMPRFSSGGGAGGGFTGGGGSTLAGATPRDFSSAYGGVPGVPSPAATASSAIGANLANLGQLYGLGTGINQFNIGQAAAPYIANLPNYQQMLAESSANILSNLQGQLSPDVTNQIIQSAAERGILTGAPGSPNANAAMLRALGLTSLGLQQAGEQQLTAAIGRTPTAQPFDISQLFITPEQVQQAQMAANLYAAAPNPQMQANLARGAAASGFRAGMGAVPGAPQITGGWGASPWSETGGDWGATSSRYMQAPAVGATGPFIEPTDPYGAWWRDLGLGVGQPIDLTWGPEMGQDFMLPSEQFYSGATGEGFYE